MVGLDLPVTPYRRELVITEALGDNFADLPKSMPMTIDYSSSLYWHREGKGLLMGFSDKTTESGFDLKRDPAFLEKLGTIAMHRAPRLMDVGIGKGWAGLYEVTPDHNAILGEFKKVSRFFMQLVLAVMVFCKGLQSVRFFGICIYRNNHLLKYNS